MAGEVGLRAEYDIFYDVSSEVTHGSTNRGHISIKDGALEFQRLRLLTNALSLLMFSVSITLKTYELILASYRPGEVPRFRDRYIQDWRVPFMSAQPVSYEKVGKGTRI